MKVAVLCVIALVAALAPSVSSLPAHAASSQAAENVTEITVGALIPQTGRSDDAGEHRTLATEFAVADFNRYLEDRGALWRLSVDIRDTGANSNTALSQATSLHTSNVTLISGPSASSGVQAIKPYADANDIIIVSCCSTSPALAIAGDNVFRLAADDSLHGPVIADLISTDGKEVLIPVWRDDTWGNGLYQSTADAFEMLGGTVDTSVGSYGTCDTNADPACYDADFTSRAMALDAAVAGHADMSGADKIVVLFIGYSETADFVRKAAEYPALRQVQWVGSDANVLDSSLVDDKAIFDFLVDANFRSCIFAEDTTSRQYMELEARFDEELESTPNVYAYATYDTIWVIGLTIEAAGVDAEFSEMKDQIPTVASEYVGMLGDIELNENGDLDESSYAVYDIEPHGWARIGTYVPGMGLVEGRSHGGGGSDAEWEKHPTFGMSLETGSQVVSCGYSMDGQCSDVLDYHVDYIRETVQTGSLHNFTLKAYASAGIKWFQLGLGVPAVGSPMSDAEAVILVELERDYAADSTYAVSAVTYENQNSVIGEDAAVNVGLEGCLGPGDETQCVQVSIDSILFREQMHHEPFVIEAVDTDRRATTHYMNEGILIQGASMNPAPTHTAGIHKSGQQHEAVPIQLVRTDKLAGVWEDQWGNDWMQNSHGTWYRVTPESFERHQDGHWNVMTRINSNFGAMIQGEQDRALLVFDSAEIQSELGAPFAYEIPAGAYDGGTLRIERLADEIALEQQRAQEIINMMYEAHR